MTDYLRYPETSKEITREELLEKLGGMLKSIKNQRSNENKPAMSVCPIDELKQHPEILEYIKKNDPKIFPLIEFFVEKQVPSRACCQGHPEEGPNGYVSFSDPEDSRVNDFVKFYSDNNEVKIGYSDNDTCNFYWPIDRTEQSSKEMMAIVNGQIDVKDKEIPEILCLAKQLAKYGKEIKLSTNITIRFEHNGISSGSVEFNTYSCKNSSSIINAFAESKFIKLIKQEMYQHEFSWENVDNSVICEIIEKTIKRA